MVIQTHRFFALSTACLSGIAACCLAAPNVLAGETRGYAVEWVYFGNSSQESDCPEGLNPDSAGIFKRILQERNTPPAEIEKLMQDLVGSMFAQNIVNRGVIDGKPANAYMFPMSTKDPMLKIGQGHVGLGFNLDGRDDPNDFVDPLTNEHGVDNQLFRAIGCGAQLRSAMGAAGTFPAEQWDRLRDSQPAWLIQIKGIDSFENDDDVEVSVFLAREPVVRNTDGRGIRSDMTFHANPIPRTAGNVVHGKIKNSLLVTDALTFFMPGEPYAQTDYAFKEAHMRFAFQPDGSLKGYAGGFQNWNTLYASWALGGQIYESTVSLDIPGLYYALKKTADAYPDPASGENTAISSTYAVDAVPAFIIGNAPAQTAEAH